MTIREVEQEIGGEISDTTIKKCIKGKGSKKTRKIYNDKIEPYCSWNPRTQQIYRR